MGWAVSSSLVHPRLAPSLHERLRVWLVVPVLSVVGHALLVAMVLAVSGLTAPVPKPKKVPSRPVSLRTVDARRWAANRGKSAQVPLIEKSAERRPAGQVVDVAPGNERRSSDAKYLAETNNRVERQTVAREQTNKYSRATPKTAPNPVELPLARGRPAPSLLGASAAELFTSQFGVKPRLSELFQKPSHGHDEGATPSVETPGSPSEESPMPGSDSTQGGGAPNDALSDLPQGDGTYLNTREWKYAGFFNRVKQAVSAQWDPTGRLRSKNKQLGIAERVTVLAVSLRPDGSVADLFVAKSSGVDDLDQEAMKAFEKAQPFANPPAALVENGFISFSFGFLVSTEGMGGFGAPQFFRTRH